MRRWNTSLVGVGCALLAAASALADTVRVDICEGTSSSGVTFSSVGSAPVNITITTTAATTQINVYSTSTNLASTGTVSFAGTAPSGAVDFIIGSGAINPNFRSDITTDALQNCAGITFPSSFQANVRLAGAIAGNLAGPLNPNSIVRLEAHGQISGAITASALTGNAIGYFQFGSSTSSGTISTPADPQRNDVNVIVIEAESTSTTIAGAISVLSGKIENIIAPGGISITGSDGIRARDGIDSIVAAYDNNGTIVRQDIDASIDATFGGGVTARGVKYLECGDLSGSVTAFTLGDPGTTSTVPALRVYGDLAAPLHFVYDMVGSVIVDGSFVGGARLRVDGSMYASVIAGGDITEIDVGYKILYRAGTPVIIKSENGDIGSIIVADNIERDDDGPGHEVLILAAGRIGSLTCVNFNGFIGNSAGLDAYVEIGDLRTTGFFNGDAWISTFDTFRVDETLSSLFTSLFFQQIPGDAVLLVGQGLGAGVSDATIVVRSPEGLAGQIIINASNGNWGWNGTVVIEDGSGSTLHTLGGVCCSPYYSTRSSQMGGGAVGRVLFRLHDADCYPPHHDQWEEVAGEPHLLNSGFSHYPGIDPESAIARFYGPMGTDADLANDEYPVAVWLWLTTAYEWVEVTDRVVVNMRATNGNLTPRDIEIHGNGTLLPPGFYAMTAILDGPDRLYCEGTFADPDSEPPPQWNIEYMSQTRVEYHFRLYQDCDLNGLEDEFELPQPPTCHGDRCPADVDDGTGSGLPDGGVTIEDLLYYLDIFDEGLSRADFDDGTSTGTPDGGVTIDDLLFFLLHFDLGC